MPDMVRSGSTEGTAEVAHASRSDGQQGHVASEGAEEPSRCPWYRTRAILIPVLAVAIGLGVAAMVRKREQMRSLWPPHLPSADPSTVRQTGLVNVYSRPEVRRPAMVVNRRPPKS